MANFDATGFGKKQSFYRKNIQDMLIALHQVQKTICDQQQLYSVYTEHVSHAKSCCFDDPQ